MSDESFEEWLADRPQVIQDMARSYPPDQRYALTHEHGLQQIGYIYSYAEDGTVTVIFPIEWNPWQEGGRRVFGIKPTDLEVFPDGCCKKQV